MTKFTCLILLLLLSPVVILARGSAILDHVGCWRLQAAFAFRGNHYFILENGKMYGVNRRFDIVYTGQSTDLGYDKPISAAVGVRNQDMFYLLGNAHEMGFQEFNRTSPKKALHDSGADLELAKHALFDGVRAAVERPNSTVIYFGVCDYVVVDVLHMRHIGGGRLVDVNLPCGIDAAWSSPHLEDAYIVKGLFVYKWVTGEARAEGPFNLFNWFCPLSTMMCPPGNLI